MAAPAELLALAPDRKATSTSLVFILVSLRRQESRNAETGPQNAPTSGEKPLNNNPRTMTIGRKKCHPFFKTMVTFGISSVGNPLRPERKASRSTIIITKIK